MKEEERRGERERGRRGKGREDRQKEHLSIWKQGDKKTETYLSIVSKVFTDIFVPIWSCQNHTLEREKTVVQWLHLNTQTKNTDLLHLRNTTKMKQIDRKSVQQKKPTSLTLVLAYQNCYIIERYILHSLERRKCFITEERRLEMVVLQGF